MTPVEPRYKISHVARLASQSRTTIERRIAEGVIRIVHLADGSIRIPESEVVRYLNGDTDK